MCEKGKILAEHYQKTYELTSNHWRQRNRTFLLLLGMIAVAALLTFRVPHSEGLLVDFIAKMLSISDPARLKALRNSFPFGIVQTILLLVVFYLMVNLYHRSVNVLRSYRYLGELEADIRRELELPDGTAAFTREGEFYKTCRDWPSKWVKRAYIILLVFLLLAFLIGKIADDFRNATFLFAVVDIIVAVPTLFFFWAYARASVSFDKRDKAEMAQKGAPADQASQRAAAGASGSGSSAAEGSGGEN